MKVLLIGNLPADGQTSMLLFQAVIERELLRLGCEVRLVTARPLALRLPHPARRDQPDLAAQAQEFPFDHG
ncbi:MAG: hypothetical protein EOO22_12320, partial [Comamonadaceae bacterium]